MAALWIAQIPVMFIFAFTFVEPECKPYIVLILLLNMIPLSILLLIDCRKSRSTQADSTGEHP